MDQSFHSEEAARKAVSLGLVHSEHTLASVLQTAHEIAGVVEGRPEALVFSALLTAYYLIHFPQSASELMNPEHRAHLFRRLVWFAEEGSVQLSNMLQEIEKIEDGVDTRRAVN